MNYKYYNLREMFNPGRDLNPNEQAMLLYKYACTIRVTNEYQRIYGSTGPDTQLTYVIVQGPGNYDTTKLNSPTDLTIVPLTQEYSNCAWFLEQFSKESLHKLNHYIIDVKYCRMVSRRFYPRKLPIIHLEEDSWAKNFSFKDCICEVE